MKCLKAQVFESELLKSELLKFKDVPEHFPLPFPVFFLTRSIVLFDWQRIDRFLRFNTSTPYVTFFLSTFQRYPGKFFIRSNLGWKMGALKEPILQRFRQMQQVQMDDFLELSSIFTIMWSHGKRESWAFQFRMRQPTLVSKIGYYLLRIPWPRTTANPVKALILKTTACLDGRTAVKLGNIGSRALVTHSLSQQGLSYKIQYPESVMDVHEK